MSVVNDVISSILWCIFGHYSQSFDWLGVYIFITNDCSLQKPLVRSLVLMPFLRFLGDILNRILSFTNPLDNAAAAVPSPLWYAGEIFGDSYMPFKALSMTKSEDKVSRFSIYTSFFLFSSCKIASIIFRYVGFVEYYSTERFFIGVSTIDSMVCFFGALSDIVCCVAMYQKSNDMLKFKTGKMSDLLKIIKNSSLVRLSFVVVLKIINGAFFVLNPCGAFETACAYGFLRGVITTVDYQFFYMDYFLSKYESGSNVKKETTSIQIATNASTGKRELS